MLERIPKDSDMVQLIGKELYSVWCSVYDLVESKYEMDRLWDNGGKRWTYQYKYRRGGKTLCTLYAKENVFGLMIILGKYEREKFEEIRAEISLGAQKVYDDSTTYHDGKWMMFELSDTSLFADIEKMLLIKRKPNRKPLSNS